MRYTMPFIAAFGIMAAACGDAEDSGTTPVYETGDLCHDQVDNDFDGNTDCRDAACAYACSESLCDDGLDNDRDGLTDCDDYDCSSLELCNCMDGIQNEYTSLIDCADTACSTRDICEAPPGMLLIHGGSFTKGCSDYDDTQPIHTVTVPPFYIDLERTSVAEYKTCIESGVCSAPPTADERSFCNLGAETDQTEPSLCVSWEQANVYCKSRAMRLCSASEWEYVFERDAKLFGLDQYSLGNELVADCYGRYGGRGPDGEIEIYTPTDGSAYTPSSCYHGTLKTLWNGCWREAIDATDYGQSVHFRCCADLHYLQ